MEQKTFALIRDWVEPAHPAVVKLYDDLTFIYKYIRERFQKEIDRTFDQVSRQIGFVVTTTVPVVLDVDKEGKVKSFSMGAEHLKGTIFEQALSTTLKPLLGGDRIAALPVGTYRLYLLWFDALSLKLRTDWMEPAHFRARFAEQVRGELAARVRPEVTEPAHWFDPGIALEVEDAVLVEAIDAVYPELKLVDRVAAIRATLRRPVRPDVQEPAHLPVRPLVNADEILRRIRKELESF